MTADHARLSRLLLAHRILLLPHLLLPLLLLPIQPTHLHLLLRLLLLPVRAQGTQPRDRVVHLQVGLLVILVHQLLAHLHRDSNRQPVLMIVCGLESCPS
jgi:hypothetical protein